MKKIFLGLFTFLLVLVGCGSNSKNTSCDKEIVFITDEGGIDDKSFNQGSWEGVEAATKAVEGACASNLTSETGADYLINLNSATSKNPKLVVAAGFLFDKDMLTVAKENPNQQYLLIDAAVMENGVQVPNVVTAVFSEHEGSYLVGVAAATTAKESGKDTVGFIGGIESELIFKFEAGYIAGVKSVDPEMKVLTSYVGSFGDAAGGKIEAEKMYNDGAYIIYHAAGGSGNGLIASAKERYLNNEEVWVIGVDRDQYAEGFVDDSNSHSIILTSMVKQVGVASETLSTDALNGKYSGGEIIEFTLQNNGVKIPDENPNLSAEAVEAVNKAVEQITSGEVVVPTTR